MAYSNYQFHSIVFPNVNFATGSGTSFKLPKGMRGRIKDIQVTSTVAFTAVTTSAKVKVGTGTDDDAFATATIGALAATDTFIATRDNPMAIIDTELPMDTQIEVAFEAPTGGTPAGTGTVTLFVNVY